MRLPEKVAVITGAARGIGRATAQLFAAEGAAVALGDVDAAGAEAAAREITGHGGKALAMALDVGDTAQVDAFVERVVRELGRLDVMMANAGIAHSAPFLEHPEAQWQRVLRVNLTGVFLTCQAAARQMVRQGGGGRIVTVASINAFRGVENLVGYNAAKAGVAELTRTLPEEARQRRVDRIPLGRFGEPEDVARAALFLASDDARYVTGHTLAVDGGYLAGGLWSRPDRPAPPR